MIPSPRTRVRVKICGITRLTDALIAVEAGVDALGFVFVLELLDILNPLRLLRSFDSCHPSFHELGFS